MRIYEELSGLPASQDVVEKMHQYGNKVRDTQRRNADLVRIRPAPYSHGIDEYCGTYVHPGYGSLTVKREQDGLMLLKTDLALELEHWHFDAWVATDDEHFAVHKSHTFDRAGRIVFDTAGDGAIDALRIALEPAVAPIRFVKERHAR